MNTQLIDMYARYAGLLKSDDQANIEQIREFARHLVNDCAFVIVDFVEDRRVPKDEYSVRLLEHYGVD